MTFNGRFNFVHTVSFVFSEVKYKRSSDVAYVTRVDCQLNASHGNNYCTLFICFVVSGGFRGHAFLAS